MWLNMAPPVLFPCTFVCQGFFLFWLSIKGSSTKTDGIIRKHEAWYNEYKKANDAEINDCPDLRETQWWVNNNIQKTNQKKKKNSTSSVVSRKIWQSDLLLLQSMCLLGWKLINKINSFDWWSSTWLGNSICMMKQEVIFHNACHSC